MFVQVGERRFLLLLDLTYLLRATIAVLRSASWAASIGTRTGSVSGSSRIGTGAIFNYHLTRNGFLPFFYFRACGDLSCCLCGEGRLLPPRRSLSRTFSFWALYAGSIACFDGLICVVRDPAQRRFHSRLVMLDCGMRLVPHKSLLQLGLL